MHSAWFILRWAWAAVLAVYCVLAMVASSRLQGEAKKRNHSILIAMAVLMAIRIAVRQLFGSLVYRCAVIIVGLAAGVAALIVARMLIAQNRSDLKTDKQDRIQSLKLS